MIPYDRTEYVEPENDVIITEFDAAAIAAAIHERIPEIGIIEELSWEETLPKIQHCIFNIRFTLKAKTGPFQMRQAFDRYELMTIPSGFIINQCIDSLRMEVKKLLCSY